MENILDLEEQKEDGFALFVLSDRVAFVSWRSGLATISRMDLATILFFFFFFFLRARATGLGGGFRASLDVFARPGSC